MTISKNDIETKNSKAENNISSKINKPLTCIGSIIEKATGKEVLIVLIEKDYIKITSEFINLNPYKNLVGIFKNCLNKIYLYNIIR